jgi:Cdc6-like AAA superfamily ATPase
MRTRSLEMPGATPVAALNEMPPTSLFARWFSALRWGRQRRSRREPAWPDATPKGALPPASALPPAPRTLPRSARWDQPLTREAPAFAPASEPGPGAAQLPADPMEILRGAFTPRQPKRWKTQFIGRVRQFERAVAAIGDEHAHIVLYGDRGRGKTSLANILAEFAAEQGHTVVRCAGSAEVTFEAIFRQLLQRIPADRLGHRSGTGESLASFLPPSSFGATELTDVMGRVTRGRVLMIIDEFDRIADPAMRVRLADAIKNLSDARVRAHLLVVGVATSLDGLLGAHPSIQRNIVGIHVPLMGAAEVEDLLSSGAKEAGITFERAVVDAIVQFSRGLPYCVQLFALYAARNAVRRGGATIEWSDFCRGADSVLEEVETGVAEAYRKATSGGGADWGARYLSAAARAPADEYGVFDPAVVRSALADVPESELQSTLDWLRGEDGGAVLHQASHSPQHGTVFADSIMRQYILLRDFVERG